MMISWITGSQSSVIVWLVVVVVSIGYWILILRVVCPAACVGTVLVVSILVIE